MGRRCLWGFTLTQQGFKVAETGDQTMCHRHGIRMYCTHRRKTRLRSEILPSLPLQSRYISPFVKIFSRYGVPWGLVARCRSPVCMYVRQWTCPGAAVVVRVIVEWQRSLSAKSTVTLLTYKTNRLNRAKTEGNRKEKNKRTNHSRWPRYEFELQWASQCRSRRGLWS